MDQVEHRGLAELNTKVELIIQQLKEREQRYELGAKRHREEHANERAQTAELRECIMKIHNWAFGNGDEGADEKIRNLVGQVNAKNWKRSEKIGLWSIIAGNTILVLTTLIIILT
jgi:hypothetical protein